VENAAGVTDSVIDTKSDNKSHWKSGGANFNWRTVFDASRELTADIDWLVYHLGSEQSFQNTLSGPGGYNEFIQGNLPSDLHIFSAKLDYAQALFGKARLTAGWKTSHVTTDNVADYLYKKDSGWVQDLGKTNHFLYTEKFRPFMVIWRKRPDAGKCREGCVMSIPAMSRISWVMPC